MFLSDQQMQAVRHGFGENTYEWLELPEGPQPIPGFVRGARIEWSDGFGNAPSLLLKTNTEAREWPGKVFQKEGSRYMAESGDGRAEIHYHSGAILWSKLNRRARCIPPVFNAPGHGWQGEAHWWQEYEGFATTAQEGYGGSSWPIVLAAGTAFDLHLPRPKLIEWARQEFDKVPIVLEQDTELVLVGPWHGGAPEGWVEVSYVDMSSRYSYMNPEAQARYLKHGEKRKWWQHTARAGLFITEDLFVRIVARFAPECRMARVTSNGWTHLEPVRPDWNEPKRWAMRRGA
jgi:hypothetical protein